MIYQKMFNVMQGLSALQKTARNHEGNYNYIPEADVKKSLRDAFIKEKLLMLTTCEGYDWTNNKSVIATTKHIIINVENPSEKIELSYKGEGTGFLATAGAITNAIKGVLLNTFLLPTYDDPDMAALSAKKIEMPIAKTKEEAMNNLLQIVEKHNPEKFSVSPPITLETINQMELETLHKILDSMGINPDNYDGKNTKKKLRGILSEILHGQAEPVSEPVPEKDEQINKSDDGFDVPELGKDGQRSMQDCIRLETYFVQNDINFDVVENAFPHYADMDDFFAFAKTHEILTVLENVKK